MGKFQVCREPDRKLSANLKALGKSSVSRSDSIHPDWNFLFGPYPSGLESHGLLYYLLIIEINTITQGSVWIVQIKIHSNNYNLDIYELS